jgi:tetratricopeptide (TPR) repeat protein
MQDDKCNLQIGGTHRNGGAVSPRKSWGLLPIETLVNRRLSRGKRISAILILQLAICNLQLSSSIQIGLAPSAFAAPAPAAKQRLLDRTPFDEITLTPTAGNTRLEVLPLNFPQGPPAALPRDGKLKVRLLDRPTDEFEVAWNNVARLRVFEQILMDEALRLAEAGKFDDAYDYFLRLRAQYPNFPGLENAISDYLQRNALALYQSKQHDRALALLLTLHQRNPAYPALPGAVQAVAGEIIQHYLREGNFAAARRVLDLWQTQFKGVAAEAAADWQRRFEAAAERQVAESNRLIAEKQYVAARKAASKATAIWPSLPSAANAMAQIERQFPMVTVGVLQAAPRQPIRRFDDWATLRASRLTQRLLAEEEDFGSEGGIYRSPFGEWNLDESGRELSFKLKSGAEGLTTDALARYVIARATPGSAIYRSDFASLLGGVAIARDNTVTINLRRVHVRPEALMQVPPPSSTAPGTFLVADYAPNQVVFALAQAGNRTGGPQAIVEQTMASDEAAVAALMAGDVEVLDRVPPWQLERLRTMQNIHVGTYKLPTVHVLVPNLKKPLLTKREFRRALCFGIDRKWIVDRVLLGGTPAQGFQPISGPFPAGASLNDPIRYGYNDQIAARTFEPRLAAILAAVAWSNVQNPNPKEKKKAPVAEVPIPELTLAYPNDPIARVACQSIQAMLVREGIPLKLREFTAEELAAGKVEFDLRYAELTIGEPLTDARQIMGPGGLSGDIQSPYLDAALRSLDVAANWKEVRARLIELHEIASHELPVIPLWQTLNYFAYRTSVRGIDESPIALYQNVDQWSSSSGPNVARTETASP